MTTPMQEQYEQIKKEHPDALVLFRLGDFYEAFGEDAKVASSILGITLTGRGKDENRQPMAGIPYHALDAYLYKLIQAGYKVAIAEQLSEPQSGKLVDRQVIKIHTPGTYSDEKHIPHANEHYLACIYRIRDSKNVFILGLLELSVGKAQAIRCESRELLITEIKRYTPAEILMDQTLKVELRDKLSQTSISYIDTEEFGQEEAYTTLIRHFKTQSLKGFGYSKDSVELPVFAVLIKYAKENQKSNLEHLTKLSTKDTQTIMTLDHSTARNLELVTSAHSDHFDTSLFHILNECKTAMGQRLLRNWILSPLKSADLILQRQEWVDFFYQNKKLNENIRDILSRVLDIERLLGKIGTNSVNGRDLLGLRFSLEHAVQIYGVLINEELMIAGKKYLEDLEPRKYESVMSLIRNSINEDSPGNFENGGIIKQGFDTQIDELRKVKNGSVQYLAEIQSRERQRTKIESLKIKFNRVFGYYIEITKSNLDKVPPDYIRKQTLANAERFMTEELRELESKILGAEEKLIGLEIEVFGQVIQQITQSILEIQATALTLAHLDVFANFATIAMRRNYIKPTILPIGSKIDLKSSRHPVVELMKAEKYIPNDVLLDETSRLMIITGPNMAGKSTYIRQVALIVLMSQIGCFIPCLKAEIGVVDRIFTRVGASDNLAAGESTFMVEMNETANILNNATENSLIVLDEIGRGTSTYDGVAIAWSVAEYVHDKIKAKTLFATHYHELIKLGTSLANAENLHSQVLDNGREIVFTYLVASGGASKSYGVHVAKLAGVPAEVIRKAETILKSFEKQKETQKTQSGNKKKIVPEQMQLSV